MEIKSIGKRLTFYKDNNSFGFFYLIDGDKDFCFEIFYKPKLKIRVFINSDEGEGGG